MPNKKTMPKTYKGKSTKPGGGGAFQMGVDAMTKKGLPKTEAAAIMANQGRKRFGNEKFAQMAATGKKRAMKKGGK